MNRRSNSSVLAAVIAMLLAVQGVAWADWDHDDDDWNKGGYGWNGHYDGYHEYHPPYYAPYHWHYYPYHYPHYYPSYPACRTCTQHQHRHNNHDHWW